MHRIIICIRHFHIEEPRQVLYSAAVRICPARHSSVGEQVVGAIHYLIRSPKLIILIATRSGTYSSHLAGCADPWIGLSWGIFLNQQVNSDTLPRLMQIYLGWDKGFLLLRVHLLTTHVKDFIHRYPRYSITFVVSVRHRSLYRHVYVGRHSWGMRGHHVIAAASRRPAFPNPSRSMRGMLSWLRMLTPPNGWRYLISAATNPLHF